MAVMHMGNRTSANRTDDQKQCAMFWMGNIEVYCLELTRMVSIPSDALTTLLSPPLVSRSLPPPNHFPSLSSSPIL